MKPFELDKLLRVFHDHYVNRETTTPDGSYEVYSVHYYPSLTYPHGKVMYLVPCEKYKHISDFTTGTYNTVGDSIHQTLDEALSEVNYNRDRDLRAAQTVERIRKEEAERAEHEASEKERKRYGGFTDGMTPLQIGKIAAVFDTLHAYDDKDMKYQPHKRLYEHIQSFVAQGFKFGGEPNSTGKQIIYHVEIPRLSRPDDSLYFKIPKVAFDYARFLGGNVESDESLAEKLERKEMLELKIKLDVSGSKIEYWYNRYKHAVTVFNDRDTKQKFADYSRLWKLHQKYSTATAEVG